MNLYLSNSVCITMRAKLVFGSMSPVISSIFAIWDFILVDILSKTLSAGHLPQRNHRPPCLETAHVSNLFLVGSLCSQGTITEGKRKQGTNSSNSGVDLSATQARVRVWRSRVSGGMALKVASTSWRMSSISILWIFPESSNAEKLGFSGRD